MNCDACPTGQLETDVQDQSSTVFEHPSGNLLLNILQGGSPFADKLLNRSFDAVLDDSPSGNWSASLGKRMLDFAIAIPVLLAFAVPMAFVAICIRLTSK